MKITVTKAWRNLKRTQVLASLTWNLTRIAREVWDAARDWLN